MSFSTQTRTDGRGAYKPRRSFHRASPVTSMTATTHPPLRSSAKKLPTIAVVLWQCTTGQIGAVERLHTAFCHNARVGTAPVALLFSAITTTQGDERS